MNYKIITYGCQMNIHESEKLAQVLVDKGFTATQDTAQADIIVFNTCTIRDGAETRATNNIAALKVQKRKNPNLIIAVCGCVPQQENAAEKLYARFPHVDIIFGTHNTHEFAKLLDNVLAQKTRQKSIWTTPNDSTKIQKAFRTSGQNAWLNICYGCDNFCSYCIVPYVRGRERSRPFDTIIQEASMLIESGYKTITLLGQNVNSYNYEGKTFVHLLEAIANLQGQFWLKFMTSHPKDLSYDVIKLIAQHEKISKHIHLPVQSGDTQILQEMNRKYTRESYLSLIDSIKSTIPDVGLTTDIIVGFPSETHEQFLNTLSLVEAVRFDNIFSFIYSKRTGTKAASLPNHIPLATKRERIHQLQALQKQIMQEDASKLIGTTQNILTLDTGEQTLATTQNGRAIYLQGTHTQGQFLQAEIYASKNSKLFGRRI